MKYKKILPLLIALLALAGIGYAVCTIVTPGASGILTGLALVNITSTINGNAVNCTVSATSALSGGTIAEFLALNTSNLYVNRTISTFAVRDANDYSFSATCYNSSSASETCSRTGVTVDNTVPVISSCLQNSVTAVNTTKTENSKNTIACTINNATSCNVYWKDTTASSSTGTTSDTSCSYTASDSYGVGGSSLSCTVLQAKDGANNWFFDCSDETNTTSGQSYKLTLEGANKVQRAADKIIPRQTLTLQTLNKRDKMGIVFGLIVVAGVILLFIVMRKK